eukprot:tig00020830_g14498.t1
MSTLVLSCGRNCPEVHEDVVRKLFEGFPVKKTSMVSDDCGHFRLAVTEFASLEAAGEALEESRRRAAKLAPHVKIDLTCERGVMEDSDIESLHGDESLSDDARNLPARNRGYNVMRRYSGSHMFWSGNRSAGSTPRSSPIPDREIPTREAEEGGNGHAPSGADAALARAVAQRLAADLADHG